MAQHHGSGSRDSMRLFSSPQDLQQQQPGANSADDATINGQASGGGSILLQGDAKSQLFASFSALSLADQYDAVLTGLCAKILDNAEAVEEDTITALQDPIQLIQEMNQKRIPASPRSLMALIDVRPFPCAFLL